MPLVKVRLHIDGDVQYERAFAAYNLELRDLSEPLRDAGDILLASVEEQYATEGAHSGNPWQPLDAAYAAWKAAHFPGAPLLVQTGQSKHIALAPESMRITPDKLVYEPDSDLLAWHFRGAGHLPSRKIVDLNTADRRGIDHAFAAWLNAVRRGPIGVRP